jgi:nitrogen fixation-related uncharacterized protein
MIRTIAITAAIVMFAVIVWAIVISVSAVKKFDTIESRLEKTLREHGDTANSTQQVREIARKTLLEFDSLKKLDSARRR